MEILLPTLTGVSCLAGFWLMVRDMGTYKDVKPEELDSDNRHTGGVVTATVLIYSVCCILLTAAISIVVPHLYPGNGMWTNIKRMILLSILWPVAYIDFKTLRIPNIFIVYGLICRGLIAVFEILLQNPNFVAELISEAVAAVALLLAAGLCVLVVKNGIGFGDIKLFLVMGLFLGMEGIWSAVFLALVVSFFSAVFLLITKKKTRKDAIPFGPALVIGAYLSICLSGM